MQFLGLICILRATEEEDRLERASSQWSLKLDGDGPLLLEKMKLQEDQQEEVLR